MGSGSDTASARLAASEFVLSAGVVEAFDMPMVNEPPLREVELRCPTGPRKLFAKLRIDGVQPSITSDNLIELGCQDCRRRLRTEGQSIALVLHRFNIIGELVETIVVPKDDQ